MPVATNTEAPIAVRSRANGYMRFGSAPISGKNNWVISSIFMGLFRSALLGVASGECGLGLFHSCGSAGAGSLDHSDQGAAQQGQVEPQALVVNVEHVQLYSHLVGSVASSARLPEAAQTRHDGQQLFGVPTVFD